MTATSMTACTAKNCLLRAKSEGDRVCTVIHYPVTYMQRLTLGAHWRQTLPDGDLVRIVEVGSGSGGTSAPVMAALADVGPRVDFVYTDLSPQLVAYGRRTYGRQHAFARFLVLDVEADVVQQVRLI